MGCIFQVKAVPETSEFDRKLQAALAELEAAGLTGSSYDLPLDRGLRKLGLRLRPSHYQSFTLNALKWFGFFAAVTSATMWALDVSDRDPLLILIQVSIGGVLFGMFMALCHRRDRRKHRLSDWDAL